MIRTSRLLASSAALAFAAAANPALAEGTQAGTTITNNVTVNYQVGGVAQTAVTATNTFTVDRKINLTVSEVGGTATIVTPGQVRAVTTFTVTNTSNDTIDVILLGSQQDGGASAFGNYTDTFNASTVRLYVDTNGNGTYDDGTDQQVTYLDELSASPTGNANTRTVFFVADIPVTKANGANLVTNDVATVTLTGTAAQGGTAGAQGTAFIETTGANTAGVDTVFADTNANGNTARDGRSFAKDDYRVSAAALTAVKSSRVVSDPNNGTTNPKAVPGAVVEYCIAVSNAGGSATATNVVVTDPVPAELTYVASSIRVNGTVDGAGVCQSDGTAGGTYSGTTVTAPLTAIAAGDTRTVRFQATIQ